MPHSNRGRWVSSLLLMIPLYLVSLVGCDGLGGSAEPKKYEGGGPLPEFKGTETPEKPAAKSKSK